MARVRSSSSSASEKPSREAPARAAAALPATRVKASGAAKRKKPLTTLGAIPGSGVGRQVALLVGLAACGFALVALGGYDSHDVSISVAGTGQTENLVGPAGAYLADGLYQAFGYVAWAVTLVGVNLALRLAGRPGGGWIGGFLGVVGFVLLTAGVQLGLAGFLDGPFPPGGLLGLFVSDALVAGVGRVGGGLVVATGLLGVATFLFRINWQPIAARAVERVQRGAPAAVRGVGALGVGAVRASLRAGGAGVDALRDRLAPGEDEEEEEEENELGEPGEPLALLDPPSAARAALVRRAPEVPAPDKPGASLVSARREPAGRTVALPEPGPELPSVWSARRAPTAPPVPVQTGDTDRDAPTKVGGRSLVEVEWEPTSAFRAGEPAARPAIPAHLRGATPAPISGSPSSRAPRSETPLSSPAPVAEALVARSGPPVLRPTPAPAPEEVYAPIVFVPDELPDGDEVAPIPSASVAWADEPFEDDPLGDQALGDQVRGGQLRGGHAFEDEPLDDEPLDDEPLDDESLVASAPAIQPDPYARIELPKPEAAPEAPASRPVTARPVSARASAPPEDSAEQAARVPKRPLVPASGPATTAPTGRRRPSGDGVEVLPGNLRSGGSDDDGRSVRTSNTPFELPPLSLLDDHPPIVGGTDEGVLHDMARRLTETLREFQVDGRVTAIRPGPVITMFEYEPAPGVKLSRIGNLADNLKMALKAISVRIVAPLPGKGCVGIEIPNERRQTVWARDVFASAEFRKTERSLPMILGKDTEGRPFVTDLAKMPHLLVGGTTGSGKSVGVNSMLVSMLYMRTPEELRMILIDPKMLEFALYEDIPHLLHPVVTEPKFASAVLKWACTEMDERYKVMARWQTRHIDSYNQKVINELKDWTPAKARSYAPRDWPEGELLPYPKKFPYIVIVIDELADLMMVASSDVEASISRIVAKARAAGIHLIVATQTPRRDVITGLIKANMPSSLSYQVRSALDSRVILDQNGAEQLLGKGDLLFLRPGTSDLVRIHAPYLSEEEVHRVADFLRAQGSPDYDVRISSAGSAAGDGDEPEAEYDVLYDEAVEIAIQKGKVSTSMLQRHLGIGYNRAANIVETMEREGVVGPADGARAREVLVGQG